ncbi:MFS transporter [Kibdelosporangium philippinense]|uniref:MFS transporter n=1 Tax=Kibdelosporangium philippinense TaxID=211113 RepID=A0ABS8Z2E8_9PSEU|nr:MFS transporter [Kibdelosporangium philippinense]MCE7001622.1 MFS transporter [Kibdelosporangium philippinense]
MHQTTMSDARPTAMGAIIVGCLFTAVSFTINAMDRQVFYPLLPEIRTEFGFSLGQGGLLATGFTLGLALAGILGGHLVDRTSRKSVLLVSIGIFSVGTLLLPLSVGFPDMAAYRIVSGIGEGLQAAAIYAAAGSFFFRRRTLAFGVLSAAFGAGVFLGPLIGSQLASTWDDWRAPFIAFGLGGLLIMLVMVFGVHRGLTEATAGGAGEPAPDVEHVPESPYNRNTLMLGIASAMGGLVFYGFLGLYPTYLRSELAFTPGQTALATGLIGAGAAMGVLFGWLGDRFDQRTLLIGTYTTVAVVAWFVYHGPVSPGWQYLLAFLMGSFGSGALFPNCNSAMTRAVRPHHIGRGGGLFLGSYYTAAATSGLLFAELVEWIGWADAALWQFTLLPVIAVVALWFVDSGSQIGGVRPPVRTIVDSRSD